MAAKIKLNAGDGHLAVGVGGLRTTITYPFVVAPGFSTGLYVCTGNNSTTPLTATYNGVALTQMSALTNNARGSNQWWALLNPDVGTHDVEFTYSTNQTSGFTIICLDGVDQTATVLDTPHQTEASSASNANENAFCGDLDTRPMYMITGCYAAGAVATMAYNTSFNSTLPFSSRTAPTNEFVDTETNYTGTGIGIAGWGRLAGGSSWKASLETDWGGFPPTGAYTYLFINETLLDEPIEGGVMMIL